MKDSTQTSKAEKKLESISKRKPRNDCHRRPTTSARTRKGWEAQQQQQILKVEWQSTVFEMAPTSA